MAPLRLIGETDRRTRRPARVLDGVAQDYRAQVAQHLSARGMTRHALLFAEANVLAESIQWFTALDGPIAHLDDLPPEPRAEALALFQKLVEEVEQEAARLRDDRNDSARVLSNLLATALEGAALADLRLVGGAPVLAGWGLRAVENAAPLPDLKGQLVHAAVIPRAPPPPPPVEPPPPAADEPTRWPLRLLGLAVLLLLFAAVLAWFLPDIMRQASALVRLPAAPVCELPAAPDGGLLRLQEEEIRLRARISELERSYAGRIQQCRIAAVPQPRAEPAPPQQRSAIDQRLDRERARSGQYQVSLIWDGPADLDLHLRCADGTVLNTDSRQGCDATLDVDMNVRGGRNSATPVENVVWAEKPPSGMYRVHVHYYDFAERRAPVPFTVRVVTAGQAREFRGTARDGAMQQVTEFTVP